MKAYIRHSIAAFALVASAGVGLAQSTIVTRETVELSPVQRETIYRTITRERQTFGAPADVSVRVGTRLPPGVELYEIPDTIVTEVPVVRRYRYMVVNDEVVLVDPATSEVVEIIRR